MCSIVGLSGWMPKNEGIVGNGNAQKFTARIAYKQNAGYNMVSLPETAVVFNHDSSEIFQSRTAEYDNKGHLTRLTRHNDTQDAVCDFSYDSYGNMVWAKLPANANSQRLEFTYSYDPMVHTYPVTVTNNSLGFSSSAEYEYLYGKPTKTTDINGNEMWYDYDPLGRTVQITAPYEQGAAPYTIRMDYSPHNYSDIDIFHNWSNPYSSAITRHYDPEHPDNDIVTTIISDGWGRMLQTKKDAEIGWQEKSIVTGKVEYDCFGRTVAQYHPFTEAADSLTRPLYNPQIEIGTATVTRYDIMDRPVRVQDPMSHVTRMSRGFSSDSSRRYFSDTIIDAKNNKVVLLKDGLGLQILQVAPMNTTTRFKYDAIGQLRKSTDPDGFDTEYWYDQFGRLTHRHHPDAGDDWYVYDATGNIFCHINALGDSILYQYHYNQLTDVKFPRYPANDVHYQYGTIADAGINAVGKVVFQEDASGWQTFKYGKLGELTENIRTFALPFENRTYTFKMNFEYDSWNRIQSMTYPDGEVVSYDYNRGGMLETVRGNKNGVTCKYIEEIRYNLFEQKDAVIYGNGTKTYYKYDSLQRLAQLHSISADGVMQDIYYSFDKVGNITHLQNASAVLSSGLGGPYECHFTYDNNYRLMSANGRWDGVSPLDYHVDMAYHDNGRISEKSVEIFDIAAGSVQSQYTNLYHYPSNSNKLALISYGSEQFFQWDATGNMVFHHKHYHEEDFSRNLCWDEQNRLQGVVDENYLSYYQYDANGDRTYKLTGKGDLQNISGSWQYIYLLDNATLYASPYLVATDKGYTKHYYAEDERIASKIGGGGLGEIDYLFLSEDTFFKKIKANGKMLNEVIHECLGVDYYDVKSALKKLYLWQDSIQPEDDCYWYHPDHLGSSSWITYSDGKAVQHLHYLPWGEDFVNQRTGSFSSMYTFSAKEKDAETGYSYFGARYYSSDLSIWLSVDPMADKYPSLSPYVYCADNPVRLVDPNGEEIGWVEKADGTICWDKNAHNQKTTKKGERYLGEEGQRSVGTTVLNYHNDGSISEQRTVLIMDWGEDSGTEDVSTNNSSEDWEANFTNKSAGVLQGFYIFLISPINDGIVLVTDHDFYGNPVTEEDKIWSAAGLLTFGTAKTLKVLRLFDKVKKTKKIEYGVEAAGAGLDINSGFQTKNKKKNKRRNVNENK
jgi:RHS repeat-associated protein